VPDAADGRAETSAVCVIRGEGAGAEPRWCLTLCPFTFAVTPGYKLKHAFGRRDGSGQNLSSSLNYSDYLGQVKEHHYP